MSQKTRFDLTQADIPSAWYNLNADFPEPLPPPLHPGTKEPLPPAALEAIFPKNLIEQEISAEKYIEIPEPVRDIYALWRPTPLLRAVRLEKALNKPAHIYYKYEGGGRADYPPVRVGKSRRPPRLIFLKKPGASPPPAATRSTLRCRRRITIKSPA